MKWKTEKVSSLCDLKNGKAYNADDWATEGLPIIRIQNLNNSSKGFNYWAGTLDKQIHVKPKDLLLAWSGTPGTSFGAHIWNGPEGVLNQHIFRIDILNGSIEKRWFQFCLNQRLNSLIHQAHGGVGLKHVTKGAVDALEIPLPPLAEQKRIAAILDAADALRAKRREALAQLEALLQSSFLTLFGDPLIRKGSAQSVEFGQLTSRITYGFTCPMDHVPSGIPIITAKNVRQGFLDFDNCHHATEIQFENLTDKCKPQKGDLLITKDGAIRGRCAIVKTRSRFCISQAVALIRPDPASVIPEYLWGYIVSTRIQRKIMDMDKGVAMPHLQITELAKFPVELPPLPLQQKFAAIVESIERQKTTQRAHLAELDALFAALQHRAFRGEL